MDDTRQPDLDALIDLQRQVVALSDAMRVRFEPMAQRLALQGHQDAQWLRDEMRTCRTAQDSGTLATLGRALAMIVEGEWTSSRPIPLDLLRLRNATTAYLGVAQGCQAVAEDFASAVTADMTNEPARELVTQIAAALDPDRTGSPAAVMVALRGVLTE